MLTSYPKIVQLEYGTCEEAVSLRCRGPSAGSLYICNRDVFRGDFPKLILHIQAKSGELKLSGRRIRGYHVVS